MYDAGPGATYMDLVHYPEPKRVIAGMRGVHHIVEQKEEGPLQSHRPAEPAKEGGIVFRGFRVFYQPHASTYIQNIKSAIDEVYFFVGMIAGVCFLESKDLFGFLTGSGEASGRYARIYDTPQCVHAVKIFPFILLGGKISHRALSNICDAPCAEHLHTRLIDLDPRLIVSRDRISKRDHLRV